MIDYVIVNVKGNEIVKSFKVGERVDSNHIPLVVEMEKDLERRRKKREKKEE